MKLREAIAQQLVKAEGGDNMTPNDHALKTADKIIDRVGAHTFKYTLLGREEIRDAFEQEIGE